MKTKFGVVAVLGLALVAFAGPVSAQCVAPTFISFNGPDVFASETAYNNATYISSLNSILTVEGKVYCFGPPAVFQALNGNGKEYMFRITGLKSGGTTTSSFGGTNYWNTPYNVTDVPATWAVYEDATPDGQINGDEVVILSGLIDYWFVQITQKSTPVPNTWAGSFNGTYHATGGTMFGHVGPAVANVNGLWCSNGPATTQCTLPAQYTAHPSGKFDQPSSTVTTSSTWGRVKLLYR